MRGTAVATVTIFNDMQPYNITGRIVAEREKSVTIECERGLRWTAFKDRVVYHTAPRAYLW